MNHRRTSTQTYKNSSKLRHNQTEAENKLWQVLRAHRMNGIHFRRQHAIVPYIVDLALPAGSVLLQGKNQLSNWTAAST